MKSSTYYFHMKMKILSDFQICISVLLKLRVKSWVSKHFRTYKNGQIYHKMLQLFQNIEIITNQIKKRIKTFSSPKYSYLIQIINRRINFLVTFGSDMNLWKWKAFPGNNFPSLYELGSYEKTNLQMLGKNLLHLHFSPQKSIED